MRIKSFRGLVPGDGRTESVAAVPYDVVNIKEAKALAEDNPDSFLAEYFGHFWGFFKIAPFIRPLLWS